MKADTEFVGTLQNRGLDKKTAAESAFELYKAHSEAQKMISRVTGTADKERILIRPKPDSSPEEISAFHEKLGRPTKAEEYDFSALKKPDGQPIEDHYRDFLRATAFKLNLSKDAATQFATDALAYQTKTGEASDAIAAGKLAAEIKAIEADWGPNKESNLFLVKQAMAKFGFTPEHLQVLQKINGATPVLKGLLNLALATGEDRFIANKGPTAGIMSKEQASARLAELRSDKDWGKRFFAGDVRCRQEFDALTEMSMAA